MGLLPGRRLNDRRSGRRRQWLASVLLRRRTSTAWRSLCRARSRSVARRSWGTCNLSGSPLLCLLAVASLFLRLLLLQPVLLCFLLFCLLAFSSLLLFPLLSQLTLALFPLLLLLAGSTFRSQLSFLFIPSLALTLLPLSPFLPCLLFLLPTFAFTFCLALLFFSNTFAPLLFFTLFLLLLYLPQRLLPRTLLFPPLSILFLLCSLLGFESGFLSSLISSLGSTFFVLDKLL